MENKSRGPVFIILTVYPSSTLLENGLKLCVCVFFNNFHHYHNYNVVSQVRKLIDNLQTAARISGVPVEEPTFSQPLPPSSFQRFLRAQPIPGVVIEDHQSAFTNRLLVVSVRPYPKTGCILQMCFCCTGSTRACTIMRNTWTYLTHQTWRLRNSWTLSLTRRRYCCSSLTFTFVVVRPILVDWNIEHDPSVSDQTVCCLFFSASEMHPNQHSLCSSLCVLQSLTEVATMVARALYIQAGGAETQLSSINADRQIVRRYFIWGDESSSF